ncbi:cation transporter dimerization domain-containing protein [Micromonospora sp. B11E3]|uniref:cation transporter dimerization domain-containing protein n=1 Tax=Micromonospora sp. B11E3 TaxID=3153562 RepID=UPI00325F9748
MRRARCGLLVVVLAGGPLLACRLLCVGVASALGDLSLVVAHEIAADAEHQLTHAVPRLTTVTVHADPDSHPGVHHHADLSHQRRNLPPTS